MALRAPTGRRLAVLASMTRAPAAIRPAPPPGGPLDTPEGRAWAAARPTPHLDDTLRRIAALYDRRKPR